VAAVSPGPDRPGSRIVLRPATTADLPDIQAIYAHHVRHGLASFEEVPPDLAEITRRWLDLAGRGLPYLVAVEAGEPVPEPILGYAYASLYRPRSAYRFTCEDSVYIRPGSEGRGIGRMLLAALVDHCTARGFRQMVAVIGDSANAASIGLHRALGFESAGVLRAVGFKHGRWVDTVLMQRALGPGTEHSPGFGAPGPLDTPGS